MKHNFEIRTLLDCWRLCRRGHEVQFSDGRRVRFETNLGFKLGTRVFFEEIASRYYFNVVQGAVYLGAMIVLVTVGGYLAGLSVWFAYAGFAIEALFLLMLSMITAYSPNDETVASAQPYGLSESVLTSVNNSVREMTNAVSNLFHLISQSDIRQDVLLTRLSEYISRTNADNIRQYTQQLEETNRILRLIARERDGAEGLSDPQKRREKEEQTPQ